MTHDPRPTAEEFKAMPRLSQTELLRPLDVNGEPFTDETRAAARAARGKRVRAPKKVEAEDGKRHSIKSTGIPADRGEA